MPPVLPPADDGRRAMTMEAFPGLDLPDGGVLELPVDPRHPERYGRYQREGGDLYPIESYPDGDWPCVQCGVGATWCLLNTVTQACCMVCHDDDYAHHASAWKVVRLRWTS